MDYAPEIAIRQSFGPHFDATRTDAVAVARLKDSHVTLHPHPEWGLPDEVTWTEDPYGNRNWAAQFQMLRWLEPLRRAAVQGDLEAKEIWTRHARSWTLANPAGTSQSPWAWADMVEAQRAMVLVAGLQILDDPTWALESLEAHGSWLTDPAHLGRANHALHQHEALFVVGSVLRRDEWVALATDRLEGLLAESYDVQGVNVEGSLFYHDLNYRWWSRALTRFDLEGTARPPLADRLLAAPIALAHSTRPDGTYERIGDGDGGRPRATYSPYTRYVATMGAEGEPPEDLVKVYDRGYAFGRSGWGETEREYERETFYSLSFGRAKRVHGHPDGGSLTYFANGHSWLVDPGKYFYGSDPMRDYVLSHAAHNVVYIPGARYRMDTVVEMVGSRLSAELDEYHLVDRGYDGTTVNRRVVYSRAGEFLVVWDEVLSDEPVDAVQGWLLDHDVVAEPSDDGFALSSGGELARLSFLTEDQRVEVARAETDPYQGWVATGWGKKEPTTRVMVHKGGSRICFVTVISKERSVAPMRFDAAFNDEGDLVVGARSSTAIETVVVRVGSLDGADSPTATEADDARSDAEGRARHRARLEPPVIRAEISAAKAMVWDADGALDVRSHTLARLAEHLRDLPAGAGDNGLRSAMVDVAGPDLAEDLAVTLVPVPNREPVLAWSGSALVLGNGLPVHSYRGQPVRLAESAEVAAHTIDLGHLSLASMVSRAPGETLTVLFHGAVDRQRTSLPRFERVRTHLGIGGPLIAVSDPTLDLSGHLRLGWYLGTDRLDMHLEIARYVSTVADELGVKNIVLVGGSGGGFAALHVGAFLPGSVVFAINPQTDLRSYFPRFTRPAFDAVFGTADVESTGRLDRVSVADRFHSTNARCGVFYVQNTGDQVHVDRHLNPFLERISNERLADVEVHTVKVDSGPGHVSVSASEYLRLWGDCLDRFDLQV